MPEPTQAIARFSLDTQFGDLPDETVHATKRVLLDTLGCVIAGFDNEMGRRLAALKEHQGGTQECTLFVSGRRLPLPSVSYVHAHLANVMDADETFHHRAHFSNVVTMPAIAAAEVTGATGDELLTAIAIGFDVAARAGVALPAYDTSNGNVRFASTFGHSYAVFGTVAAVGRLLGLDEETIRHAMGIAYVSAPVQAAWQVFPGDVKRPMTKYTMYGEVAEAGVNAVLLAASGFTGNYDVLDPPQQYWKGLGAIGCDYDALVDRLGERWYITETAFKVYPFGRQANIPIDLLLQIASENGLSADDIDEVMIRMPPSSITDELRRPPAENPTQLDASFNLRHALSAAISGLTPGPQWLSRTAVADPKLRAFGDKIAVEPKPEWREELEAQLREDGWFARIPTEVEVSAGGRTFTAAAEYAKGDPWTPETTVSDDEIVAKFVEYTRHALGRVRSDEAVERVFGLDGALGVQPLLGALHR